MHYLYRITNQLNGKVYIGQSNKEAERWRQHKYYATQNEPRQYIHRAIAKYGVANFVYEVIATCKTPEDADELETQLITRYDSRNKSKGYNISPGGDPAWNRGLPKEHQPMYGKEQSDYQKQRASEIHSGKTVIHTQEWRNSMSQIMTGRIIDDDWREKLSKSNSGQTRSEETKNKMSKAKIGTHLSIETKAKISAALKGKKRRDKIRK